MNEQVEELTNLANEYPKLFDKEYWKKRKQFDIKRMSKAKRVKVFNWLREQTCYCCESKTNLHRHHKLPLSCGGANDYDNIVALCKQCHEWVHGYEIKRKKVIKLKKVRFLRKPKVYRPKKDYSPMCGHGRMKKWCTICRYKKGQFKRY